MKTLRKAFAAICSLALMISIVSGTTVANAAGKDVDTAYVNISLDDTYLDSTNSFTINFNTQLTKLGATIASVYIPTNLKSYISGWEWQDVLGAGTNVVATSAASGSYVGTNYIQLSTSLKDGVESVSPQNGVYAQLKVTLTEELPKEISLADKTIEVAGQIASRSKYCCAVEDITTSITYSSLKSGNTCGNANATYWVFDPAVEGNYVVVPTVEPTEVIATATEAGEKDATAIGDTYYGDTDTTDTAVAYGVGLMGEENQTYTNVLWTVTANGETKYHKSPVNVSGAATYKIGLVIQGLTKDMVTAVKAVLQ